jgi:hypothetical protein
MKRVMACSKAKQASWWNPEEAPHGCGYYHDHYVASRLIMAGYEFRHWVTDNCFLGIDKDFYSENRRRVGYMAITFIVLSWRHKFYIRFVYPKYWHQTK